MLPTNTVTHILEAPERELESDLITRQSCRYSEQPKVLRISPENDSKIEGTHKQKSHGHKHVPHKEKPAHLVARRNARERLRVQAVNNSFAKLRKFLPSQNRNKRLSKVKTLKTAIDYIHHLQDLLNCDDSQLGSSYDNSYETSEIIQENTYYNSNRRRIYGVVTPTDTQAVCHMMYGNFSTVENLRSSFFANYQ